ncbi:MAG: dNTP triphosphohydrolase [Pirellulaceae bacterium]|nr:dNTP triphosphohydrolase [Pirellulaceae bacterium]
MPGAQSLGREFPEAEHPYRGPFQRDRDRILHSASFRRLSGKMQVFTGDMGDYHRTRLTHTMEVASIARTIGRALGLNEDLIEALALMHDVGHPPFGHAGEDALDECLADEGGFSHNQFALTLVCQLEVRCQAYPGLNLTREVLAGQQYRAAKAGPAPLLEAQVVDAADSITYNAHDTDDAVMLGLVSLDELADLPLVANLLREIQDREGPLPELTRRKALVHALIDRQVEDLLLASWPRLAAADFRSADQPARAGFRLAPSPGIQQGKTELERFLYQRVYRHPRLIRVRQQAQRRLRELFAALRAEPARLPPEFAERVDSVGLPRAVGDYLASLTDRSCDQLYCQLFPIGWGDGPKGTGW